MKKEIGFDYYLSKDVIKDYQNTPYSLRLKWLYAGCLFRKGYPKRIIELQDRFRKNKE